MKTGRVKKNFIWAQYCHQQGNDDQPIQCGRCLRVHGTEQ
ncbi:MAG TPA: hypothetical protein EYH03_01240 [Chromatiales bacterium]|nr:hypothetical protein [Chromatiales bacterium]